MHEPGRPSPRRSPAEWAQLVAAWQRSGLTAKAFAVARGVAPSTLTWWKWRLAHGPAVAAPHDVPRLVPVQIEPAARAPTAPAWELALADGHVLCVHADIAPEALRAVLDVFTPRRPAR